MYTWLQALEMAAKGTPMCNIKTDYYMKMDGNCLVWFCKCDDILESEVIITTGFLNDNFVPYVKKVKLTDDEKVILRNLPEEYKWIARDSIDNSVFVAKEKPEKNPSVLLEWDCPWERYVIIPYNHLFQQIKWEDAEPTMIADLLKE